MKKGYSIRVKLWSSLYGGNLSIYYYKGMDKNKNPILTGVDRKKVYKNLGSALKAKKFIEDFCEKNGETNYEIEIV